MARGLPNWRMSAPAMKLRPAPIITIAFTPTSTSPFSSASTMPSRTPSPNALTGGLSMVMTPTPSSTSNRTSSLSPSAMAFPPACPASSASRGGIELLSQHCRFSCPAATQKRSRSDEARSNSRLDAPTPDPHGFDTQQGGRHGRGNETAAGTHAGDQALLGGHAGWRVTAAALRRLRAYVLSAPAVLSEMRRPQPPQALVLDMPLDITFERQTDAITLPFFKPAGSR